MKCKSVTWSKQACLQLCTQLIHLLTKVFISQQCTTVILSNKAKSELFFTNQLLGQSPFFILSAWHTIRAMHLYYYLVLLRSIEHKARSEVAREMRDFHLISRPPCTCVLPPFTAYLLQLGVVRPVINLFLTNSPYLLLQPWPN